MSDSAAAAPSPPQIPDHTIIRLIGKGSYGEVWLARNIVGTSRAIKVIYRESFDHDRPYEREFQGIKHFEPLSRCHEGLIDILQLGRDDAGGYFYYVMEVADNASEAGDAGAADYAPRTLRSELYSRGRFSVPECLNIGLKMTEALDYLHRQGLVHRDIKPSNILFVGGAPKLADVGLVAGVNETRSYVGTEGYIPPEGPGSPQADIYSLGKVLYELSTGKDRQDYPELPSEFQQNPERRDFTGLNDIILKACMEDPQKRYQSAAQMHAELSALTEGKTVKKLRARQSFRAAVKAAGVLLAGLALYGMGVRIFNPGWGAGALAVFGLGVLWFLIRQARRADTRILWKVLPAAQRQLWFVAAFLLLTALVSGIVWIAPPHTGLVFAARDFILIADFSNRTGDPTLDTSLWTALNVSLRQSRYINVLPHSRIYQAFAKMGRNPDTPIDDKIAREIALRENARALIRGDLSSDQGKFLISVRLVNPRTNATLRSYREIAGRDHLMESLDQIAMQIRKDLGEPPELIRQTTRPLSAVTTRSLDALKLFADGLAQWRKGLYAEGIKSYEAALAIDPDFAMVHAELGKAYFSFIYNQPLKGEQHYKAALATADRITDRERLYIEASYKRDLGHMEEAIRYHRLYLAAYPDDADTRYNFATFLFRNQRLNEAIEQFQEVIRVSPNHASAKINLATSLQQLDRCEEALVYYSQAFALEPGYLKVANLNSEHAFTLARVGRLTEARSSLDKILALPDTRMYALRSLALLDMYEGKYREARQRLLESNLLAQRRKDALAEGRNHIFLQILLAGYGDRARQVQALDEARKCLQSLKEPAQWLAARIGAAYARTRELTKAAECLVYVRKNSDPKSAQSRSYLYLLEGELALAQGKHPKGLELLQSAHREMPTSETMAGLAHAYDVIGATDEAIEHYEKVIQNGRAFLSWEPQQDWIIAHMRLAELYLKNRQREKAAKALQPVLELWQQADPDLPLTARLRKLSDGCQATLSGGQGSLAPIRE